jgi:hypothetical protein
MQQQRPFAYLPPKARKIVRPLNYKWDYFPSNYVAICQYCLKPYQKAPEALTCTRCKERCVLVLPTELLPWRLLPPRKLAILPRLREYLTKNYPFVCQLCGIRYGSMAIFLTLCLHKDHLNFVCRFCCREKSDKLMKALDKIDNKIDNKLEEGPKPLNLRGAYYEIFHNALPPEIRFAPMTDNGADED